MSKKQITIAPRIANRKVNVMAMEHNMPRRTSHDDGHGDDDNHDGGGHIHHNVDDDHDVDHEHDLMIQTSSWRLLTLLI